MKKIAGGLAIFSAVVIVSVPLLASAADFDATCIAKGGCWGPLITCTGDYENLVGHTNPVATCTSVCDITVLILRWIFFFYTIILYLLVPLGVAVGGFIWLTSAGSEKQVTLAREIFGKVFRGLGFATVLVILLSFIIGNIGVGQGNATATTPLGMTVTCNRTNNPLDVNLQTPGQ